MVLNLYLFLNSFAFKAYLHLSELLQDLSVLTKTVRIDYYENIWSYTMHVSYEIRINTLNS